MTEKIETIEIHPMRGHERGEWYGSQANIVDSDQDAEYWALFGVTHRGNRHCLGEFPTRKSAQSARSGIRLVEPGKRKKAKAKGNKRKIIQIDVTFDHVESTMVDIFALCDDGTVWRRGIGVGRGDGLQEDGWEQITLDGIHDDMPEQK